VVARLEPGRRGKVSQKITKGRDFFRPNPASGRRFGLTSIKKGLQKRFPAERLKKRMRSIEKIDSRFSRVPHEFLTIFKLTE
jgi:hypothetical protein